MDFPSNTSDTNEYAALKAFLDDNSSLDETINKFTSNSDSSSAEDKLLRSWDALGLTASKRPQIRLRKKSSSPSSPLFATATRKSVM
ncbi:hypothetical protein KCU73_g13159, partial [Aureobasidium melanogenum]